MHDAAAVAKSAKKFHIFHERHVWKSPSVNKRCSPAEHAMIAASHSEQKPRVMRKAVRQSVNGRRGRQADPKETAADFGIAYYPPNLIQRFQRHFGVCMQKPQNIAVCGIGSDIHLFCTATIAASDNLIAEAFRQLAGTVSARAVDDNNFRPTGAFAQVREKRAYQQCLIKDWNNNRDLH
jgi:AraC-like DNA-binding protein